jgi:hypothetical protein
MRSPSKTLSPWIAFALVSLSTSAAMAAGVEPTAATPAQVAQAQKQFERGRGYVAKKEYDKALTEFRASFDIVASPNTRFSIARALRDMGNFAEAYAEFGRTIAEASALAAKEARYQQTADAAASERGDLESKIALVTFTVAHAAPDSTLKVGAREVPQSDWSEPVPIAPGSVDAIVSTGGREAARTSLTVTAGEKKNVTLDAALPAPPPVVAPPAPTTAPDPNDSPFAAGKPLPEAPKAPPAEAPHPTNLRPHAYVAGGVAAAGFVTFAIFGALEKGTFSNLQDQCHGGPCGPDHASDISSGRTQQTVANVGLVVGIVGLAAGVVLFVVSRPSKSPGTGTAIVVGPSFIGVRGSL